MKYGIKLILIILVLAGCKSKVTSLIADYELTTNKIKVQHIDTLSPFKPFLAADSIQLLNHLFDSMYYIKLAELQNHYDSLNSEWESAVMELENIENPLMYKPYEHQVKKIKIKVETAGQIMETYKNHPEQTQLWVYKILIGSYAQNTDSLLGYTLIADFVGKQGKLKPQHFKHTYFINPSKNQIVAHW